MPEQYLDLFLTLAVVVSAFVFAFSSLRKARLIEDTPTSVIRSAPQGYVELTGTSKPDQKKLTAPLTASPCLWFHYKVEKHVRSGKKSYWKTVKKGTSDFSFFLEDETGLCHIHPDGAHVVPNVSRVWYGSSSVPDRAPGASISIFSSRRYRYTEKRIHEGEMLYALGLFHSIGAPSAGEQAKDHMAKLLSIWKADRVSLLQRFDKNADGEIDVSEWELARAEAAEQAQVMVMENYESGQTHILKQPEGSFYKFIISTKPPDRLVERFRWQGWLSILGFLLALAFFAHQLNQLLFPGFSV